MKNARNISPSKRLQLPKGFRDKVGESLRRQRLVEAVFRQEGFSRGYHEIQTPILERAEALPKKLFACWKKQGFIRLTLVDYDNKSKKVGTTQAILRPEGTIPVCRWLATKLAAGQKVLPAKLIYSIDCYRNEPIDELKEGKFRQFDQLGVELMGADYAQTDAEVIEYAFAVLRKVGVKKEDIRIRLGDINFFKKLSAQSGFNTRKQYALQERIDNFSKDRALGRDLRINLPHIEKLAPEVRKKWALLLDMYGPFTGDVSAIDVNLNHVANELVKRNVPVCIDFSVVRGFSYYTGPVFQIDVRKDGKWVAEVAGGGRYDDLVGQNLRTFGIKSKVPATGFAFGTERLVNVSNLPCGRYSLDMII
jgi:histidyl-tRNA synthetase